MKYKNKIPLSLTSEVRTELDQLVQRPEKENNKYILQY